MLPFGRSGWKEKIRIFEEIISSRTGSPFLYNDVLILVSSTRMIRLYGRLLLDAIGRIHGTAALVQPEIQTLHQFLQKNFARLDAPRLIDEDSRLVLVEGLVKEALAGSKLFNRSPDLLAPALSSVLAKMIEQLSAAEVTPENLVLKLTGTPFLSKPQVSLLIDVYSRYKKALQKTNLTDPAGMESYLRDHFDPEWLAPYQRIVIDGILPGNKAESEILKKIGVQPRCTCLIDAPSANLVRDAPEYHPLTIVKDMFSLLGIMPDQGVSPACEDDRYLASALFSSKTFSDLAGNSPDRSSFSKDINVLSAVNSREEVSLIAGEVKKSLRKGIPPDSILVAFPALDEYADLAEEIFNDYRIPYNRALGRQLSSSAVTSAVISLLRSCQEDYSGPSLLRVFGSPFIKFAENREIGPALDRLMRRRAISGGKQKLLAALEYHDPDENNVLNEALNGLFTALEPFLLQHAAPLSVWMERLTDLTAWSGIADRISLIKGPLNINLQAYRKLTQVITSLAHAGRTFPDYRYTFNEWFFLLKKTFMHARFQVPPEDEGGVQIMGVEESLNHPWSEIYLGGLVDGKFPQRLPQNIFLPEQTLESMGIRTLERARLNASYHFYRLLLSADKVMLTCPENEGDRTVVPSPYLEELAPLKKAGLLNRGMEKTSGIQFSLKIEDSRSIPELAKAISLAGDFREGNKILNAGIEGMAGLKSAINFKETDAGITSLIKRRFSVTELDAYLNCPYDYYIINVLRIEPLEEVSEDISPMNRGSKVHAILRNFYLSWERPVTGENRGEALILLRKLADSAFDSEADTFRNRREKHLFLNVMAERFLSAEIGFWKQGMRPVYLEQKIERYPLALLDGKEVELSAKIDRIDADEDGNFIIVDYKTGKYPAPRMGIEQDIFQLPVYASMARGLPVNAGAQPGVLLRKPVGLAYYDLMGKTNGGGRDVVIFNKDACNKHPSSKPKASAKSAGEFETILKQSMDKARKAVEHILAGDFAPAPQDENKCRYCQNDVMCGKNEL